MADPRAYLPVLEQPRFRRLAIAALAVLMLAALVLFLRRERERVEGHAFAIPSPRHRIMIEVLNGTARPGLARVATRLLRRHGFDVVFFGNADSPAEVTRILVRRGDPAQGRDVRVGLGVGRLIIEPDTLRRVDVTVILGDDYRPRAGLHP
jgi:hypothetical protein